MRVNSKFYFITMLILVLIALCSVNCFAQKFVFGIGTGSTSGSWYPLGGTLSGYINKYIPGVNCWPEVTGSTLANLDLIENGDVLLGFAASNGCYRINEETKMPENIGWPKNIRSIALVGYSHGTFVVLEDSKIQKIQDLKGKRIVLGAPGEGQIVSGIHLLEAAGIDWQKDVKTQALQIAGMKDALISKRIDAGFFQITSLPSALIVDLSVARPIRLLDIPLDLIKKVQDKYGKYIAPLVVKAGVYPWMKEPFTSYASFTMFLCHKDADEDLIYKIIKLIYEKQEEMAEAFIQISDWQFNSEAMFINEVIPLHPGARKFYKEIGLLK